MKTTTFFLSLVLFATLSFGQSATDWSLRKINSQIGIGSGNINNFNIPY
jgi:hypothetical protein